MVLSGELKSIIYDMLSQIRCYFIKFAVYFPLLESFMILMRRPLIITHLIFKNIASSTRTSTSTSVYNCDCDSLHGRQAFDGILSYHPILLSLAIFLS